MAWQVESLRATIFATDIPALGLPSFDKLTGNQPEQTVTRAPGNIQQQTGMYGVHQLVAVTQPGRADIGLAPSPTPVTPQSGPVSLGEAQAMLAEFEKLLMTWATAHADISRLAVGATIWQPADDPTAALNIIMDLIPSFHKEDNKILHFLLQINRPRDSAVIQDLEINRLVTWQTAAVQVLNLDLTGTSTPTPLGPFHRAQANIDINSAEREALIPSAQAAGLAQEFVRLAAEISERGDIP